MTYGATVRQLLLLLFFFLIANPPTTNRVGAFPKGKHADCCSIGTTMQTEKWTKSGPPLKSGHIKFWLPKDAQSSETYTKTKQFSDLKKNFG